MVEKRSINDVIFDVLNYTFFILFTINFFSNKTSRRAKL